MISYLLLYKPFILPKDTYMELYNEGTILTFMYVSLGITTDSLTGEMRQQIGDALIAFIIINLVVNFLIFAQGIYVQLKPKLAGLVLLVRLRLKKKQQKHVTIKYEEPPAKVAISKE